MRFIKSNCQTPVTDLMMAFPWIEKLPSDSQWEAIEQRMVKHHNQKLPPFEE